MTVQGILAIFGAIVTVAMVTTIVTRPNSATIINSIGSLFTGALRTAMGR